MKIIKDNFELVLENLNGEVDTMEICAIELRIYRRYGQL